MESGRASPASATHAKLNESSGEAGVVGADVLNDVDMIDVASADVVDLSCGTNTGSVVVELGDPNIVDPLLKLDVGGLTESLIELRALE